MSTTIEVPSLDISLAELISSNLQVENNLLTHPTGRVHKYPLRTGALINSNDWRPAEWNEEVAKLYSLQEVNTNGWTYEKNFSKLNMYQRWTQTCLCCKAPIIQCLYNETLYFGAEQWQAYYKEYKSQGDKMTALLEAQPSVTNSSTRRKTFAITADIVSQAMKQYPTVGIVKLAKQLNVNPSELSVAMKEAGAMTTSTRGRKRTTVPVSGDILNLVIARYPGTSLVSLAKEFNVNLAELTKAVKAEGVVVQRGAGNYTGRRGRERKTNLINQEIIQRAMAMLPTGVVAIAKELNVNPAQLSAALKTEGIVIRKGRRSSN